jgi:hypothetical protein
MTFFPGLRVVDMMMHLGALIITFKSLPMGPEINEEDGRLDFGIVLLGNNGLFGGVHAADRRAIGPAPASRMLSRKMRWNVATMSSGRVLPLLTAPSLSQSMVPARSMPLGQRLVQVWQSEPTQMVMESSPRSS